MFEKLVGAIDSEVVHRIYRVSVQPQEGQEGHVHQRANAPAAVVTNESVITGEKSVKKSPAPVDKKKLGRNDPCWCGSGKKYKKCHYPN